MVTNELKSENENKTNPVRQSVNGLGSVRKEICYNNRHNKLSPEKILYKKHDNCITCNSQMSKNNNCYNKQRTRSVIISRYKYDEIALIKCSTRI